jgi:hypothetical protein
MDQSSTVGRAVMGFVAGALSVVTFFFAAWAIAQATGYIPAAAEPVWSMKGVAPWGVPRAINLAFWGGVWGLVLSLLFGGLRGASNWLAWILAGAIAVSAVAIFVVPAIKGLPINTAPQRLVISGLLNGIFGLGTAIWLRLVARFGG